MSEVQTAPAELNGSGGGATLEVAVAAIREAAAALEARRAELTSELMAIEPQLKRYRKAIEALTGERPERQGGGRPRGRPRKTPGQLVRTSPSGLSDERLEIVRAAIRRYCEDHEEFRQVDIRASVPDSLARSSIMARGFEMLREEGMIRLARQEGINKWFRLTRRAVREGEDA